MNWEALGAVAELLGAIAVFATLAYLSVQIRQSNVVMREQAQYHMLQNQVGYFDRLAESPDLVRIVYDFADSEQEVRERRHEAHIVSLLFKWNWEFLRVKDGTYSVDSLPVEGYRWQFRTIDIESHWEEKKAWLDSGFVEFMERDVIPFAHSSE